MLSGDVLDGDEAYEFTWVGKKAAIVEANKPIRKTLRPCKQESVNWDTTENLYMLYFVSIRRVQNSMIFRHKIAVVILLVVDYQLTTFHLYILQFSAVICP